MEKRKSKAADSTVSASVLLRLLRGFAGAVNREL